MSHFQKVVERTLGYEGGYSNDPNDSGGKTRWGISQRAFPTIDIENLTRERAIEIYKEAFWDPLKLDQVKDIDVAAEIFDTNVNSPNKVAARIAQRCLNACGENLKVDGVICPATLAALNQWAVKDKEFILTLLNICQGARYINLCEVDPAHPDPFKAQANARKMRTFLRGWIRKRVQLTPSDLLI